MCGDPGDSRSGFHAWLTRAPSARARSDEKVGARVKVSHIASDRTYGARRVWHDMLAEGIACGLHRIERLMRQQGLRARPRRRGLPKDQGERAIIAGNVLDRQFMADAPNRKWVADFTYIWTAEGWLYVAAVIDLFSRRVVGWSMKAEMTAQLVADALIMAIWRPGQARCPAAPFRSRQPIYQRAVPAADGRQRRDLLDEPVGQLLGQCRHGKLLLLAQDRAGRQKGVPIKG